MPNDKAKTLPPSSSLKDTRKDGSSVSSASSLILLQICARLLTFFLNQVLVRLVSPKVFGVANIQLELLLSTILFLSREAIRNVLVRKGGSVVNHNHARVFSASVHNISLLPLGLGTVLSSIVAYLYSFHLSPLELRNFASFRISVGLYVLGALAELVLEPMHILSIAHDNPALRVKAEGIAVFAKCIGSVASVVFLPRIFENESFVIEKEDLDRTVGLLAFGLGQLVHGLSFLVVYSIWFVRRFGFQQTLSIYSARADSIKSSSSLKLSKWLDIETLSLCWAMTKQGLLKHALTEGDKFAIARFASLEDQGGYALASNYGSLVTRILFQPIEETSRLVFSQSLVSLDPEQSEKPHLDPQVLDTTSLLLATLFRVYLLLGAVFVCFGSSLSVPFLYIMAGPKWALDTHASHILAIYMFYIPVMAINGVTEGFLQSTASKRQLERYNRVLILASLSFILLLASTARIHLDMGKMLVWSNVISLAIRAIYCWSFMVKYFTVAGGQNLAIRLTSASTLPHFFVLTWFSILYFGLHSVVPKILPTRDILIKSSDKLTAIRLLSPAISVAAVSVVFTLAICFVFERHSIISTLVSLRSNRKPKSQ